MRNTLQFKYLNCRSYSLMNPQVRLRDVTEWLQSPSSEEGDGSGSGSYYGLYNGNCYLHGEQPKNYQRYSERNPFGMDYFTLMVNGHLNWLYCMSGRLKSELRE